MTDMISTGLYVISTTTVQTENVSTSTTAGKSVVAKCTRLCILGTNADWKKNINAKFLHHLINNFHTNFAYNVCIGFVRF